MLDTTVILTVHTSMLSVVASELGKITPTCDSWSWSVCILLLWPNVVVGMFLVVSAWDKSRVNVQYYYFIILIRVDRTVFHSLFY